MDDASQQPQPPHGFVSARLPGWAWGVLVLAVLGLALGRAQLEPEKFVPLVPVAGEKAARGSEPFVPHGVFSATDGGVRPKGVATHGSWLETDAFTGTYTGAWFRAARRATILVAGYPTRPGNSLAVEARLTDGSIRRIEFTGPDPRESWQRWVVELPDSASEMRLVATDGTVDAGGWLGLSDPFSARRSWAGVAWPISQLTMAGCLAIAVLYFPGLLWLGARTRTPVNLALAILPGPLLVALAGALGWALGGTISPVAVARAGLGLLLAAIGVTMWRRRKGPSLPAEMRAVVTMGMLVVGFAVMKANVSRGPAGELYYGTVSRTLAVGGHSDSRISYHTVQVVAHHFAPFEPAAERYFSPWHFASRGPLAGLAAAAVVLASNATVPLEPPNQPWAPFDDQGFAVYRIVLIVLASFAAWAVFALVATLSSTSWGLIAAMAATLTPFYIHESFFSWPKLLTAALTLASFLLAHLRRPLAAGAVLGVAYLFHPLALLSTPFIGLWLLLQSRAGGVRGRLIAGVRFGVGLMLCVAPWAAVGSLHPGTNGSMGGFVSYFGMADGRAAHGADWWRARWDNFANTFVPGYLLGGDPNHESINSVYHKSDGWVRASFLFWNTLPAALGVFGSLLAAVGAGRLLRRQPAVALLLLIGPALLLIFYWGAARTGLMRHCGHVLFLTAIVAGACGLARWPTSGQERWLALLLHPLAFAWRAFEIALFTFGTTLLNYQPGAAGRYLWNDAVSFALAAGFLTVAATIACRHARSRLPELRASPEPAAPMIAARRSSCA